MVAFARHASRRTVTLEDVQLVARKDPGGLQAKLASFAKREKLTSGRREAKSNSPQTSNNAATPMTQRMRALTERLKKGIDSSEDGSENDNGQGIIEEVQTNKETVPFAYTIHDDSDDDDLAEGKENQKMQPLNTSKTEEDPFASSEDEKEAVPVRKQLKNAAVATFPTVTKTDLSSDESAENMFE